MTHKQKTINLNKSSGTCPFCESVNYVREDIHPEGDIIVAECFCEGCNKGFKEYFDLVEQHWEAEE
jgi:transposase-like protein